jgi:hypothetical protein
MTLNYELKFYDYWHLGSGLSAGTKSDSTVTKDKNDLPYASGKTIKGLIKEQAQILYQNDDFIDRCFGNEGKYKPSCYFKNAIIDETTNKTISKQIIENSLQNRLYDTIASTQIGKNGIAVDDSLREIEVVIPISLYGQILDIENQDDFAKLSNSLKMIKRMGLNRNRGLGRCEFIIKEGAE